MILKLIRFYKNEHATDCILTLHGRRLCNTAEHTPCCLKKGKYPIMISTYTLVQPKNFEWPMARNQEEAELIANAEEKAAKSERQEGGEYLPLPAIARKMPCLYPSAECQQPLGCLRFGNGIFTLADASIIVGERQASGLCIKTREVFDKLYNRIRKCLDTGEKVALVVEDLTEEDF